MNIHDAQNSLPGYWTDSTYPDDYNEKPLPHRHYNHAVTHAMKALGGLAALSDAMDHERMNKHGDADPEAQGCRDNAGKWLADLVICATRMAQQLNIDLDDATSTRIDVLKARWSRS